MSGFKCPFCEQTMSLQLSTQAVRYLNFKSFGPDRPLSPTLEITIYRCPTCENETVYVRGINGYCENNKTCFYPGQEYVQFPDYVPQAIRQDYKEASCIVNSSPRAAATLARRCLQGMIHDFWGIHEKNLNAEISTLKTKVTSSQWAAIDGLRKIGNIGAHMESNIDLIVDVEPEEAAKLLQLIELLIGKWYIGRHDEEKLLAEVVGISVSKDAARTAE